jgi:hypothetical protein
VAVVAAYLARDVAIARAHVKEGATGTHAAQQRQRLVRGQNEHVSSAKQCVGVGDRKEHTQHWHQEFGQRTTPEVGVAVLQEAARAAV